MEKFNRHKISEQQKSLKKAPFKLARSFSNSFHNVYIVSSSDSFGNQQRRSSKIRLAKLSPFQKFRKTKSCSATSLDARFSSIPLTKSNRKAKVLHSNSLREIAEKNKTLQQPSSSCSTHTLTKIKRLWQMQTRSSSESEQGMISNAANSRKSLKREALFNATTTESSWLSTSIGIQPDVSPNGSKLAKFSVGADCKKNFSVSESSSKKDVSSWCSGDYSGSYNTFEIRHSEIKSERNFPKSFSVDDLSVCSVYINQHKKESKFYR